MEKLYSIMDTKQARYGSLMTFVSDADAIRAFQTLLTQNEQGSMLALYPTDYTMFCLGCFDKEKGLIEGCIPQLVITGLDALTRALDEHRRRLSFQKQLRELRETDTDDVLVEAISEENS